jgi:2Fe-2S ferredoxin
VQVPIITFLEVTDAERRVEASVGETAMRAAVNNGIAGIDGDCGGVCACATCHVYVDEHWFEKVGPPNEQEERMLEVTTAVTARSRLACQIEVRADLDGLVLQVADNFR